MACWCTHLIRRFGESFVCLDMFVVVACVCCIAGWSLHHYLVFTMHCLSRKPKSRLDVLEKELQKLGGAENVHKLVQELQSLQGTNGMSLLHSTTGASGVHGTRSANIWPFVLYHVV